LKLLLGKRDVGVPLPGGLGGVGEPPGWLTPAQQGVWTEIVSRAPPGLLQPWHAHVLERLCVQTVLVRKLSAQVQRKGLLQKDRVHGGQERQAAWLKALRAETTLLLKLCVACGFTPSASAVLRIPPPPSKELSEFEKLMS
jgi:phage terminase small subunit